MQAERVADLFTVIMTGTEARRPSHGELLQAFSLAFNDSACDALRVTVAALLEAREQPLLARALRREEIEEEEETQRVPDFGKGRVPSLGERKSLARRNDRDLIARVLRDPHPDVIRILLGNPALTEEDVVRLCARRPASREVQREVFGSPRWIVRYTVKTALVLNPYTPIDVALQIAPHLKAQDLRRVARSNDLGSELRQACGQLTGQNGDRSALH
jgi:hypothetical protein